MAHHYAVGVKDQAPLLFVVAATASPALARVTYTEIEGRSTGASPAADRPIWSRVTVVGSAPSTVTPDALNPFSPAAQFRGEFSYASGWPTVGTGYSGFPVDARDGYGAKILYAPNSGPIIPDDCPLAIIASGVTNWEWDVNLVFEEL